VRVWIMAVMVACVSTAILGAARQQAGPSAALPDRDAFAALTRSAARVDTDLQRNFTYIERRRDIKISTLGKVSVEPLRTFEVFPAADPHRTYKRLIAIDDTPLSAAEIARRDAEHQREADEEEQRLRRETPSQQAKRKERMDRERQETLEVLEDALRVFTVTPVARESMHGHSIIQATMTPRGDARVTTRQGSWMKQFAGRAWFVEKDGQLARLDMQAMDDVSIGWGVVGRLHKGSRLIVERSPIGAVWLPMRLRFTATGRTMLFRTFEISALTEYSEYRSK
jgi:hypothetical protein